MLPPFCLLVSIFDLFKPVCTKLNFMLPPRDVQCYFSTVPLRCYMLQFEFIALLALSAKKSNKRYLSASDLVQDFNVINRISL